MKPLPEKWRFAYLHNENDNTCRKQELVKSEKVEKEKLPRSNIWSKLHGTPTYSIEMKYSRTKDNPVHHDELDFGLQSTFDQVRELFVGPERTKMQPETEAAPSTDCTYRYRPCMCEPVRKVRPLFMNHPLYDTPVTERATNLNNVKLAIECPHIPQTNNGYSRNSDGGAFYCA